MSTEIRINKLLATAEDIALGEGTVEQTRNGKTVTLTKVNAGTIPYDETKSIKDKIDASGGGSGQMLGEGPIKAISYGAQDISEDIVIGILGTESVPLNAMAIDSVTINDGGSITIEDGSVFKIV